MLPRSMGVYQILNTANGKLYVGSSINLRKRERSHLQLLRRGIHRNPYLQRSWSEHGAESFVFSVLELVEDAAQLTEREQHYLDTVQPEYNIVPTAGSMLGFEQPEESRAKTSAASLAKWADPEYRKKVLTARAKAWEDPEVRRRHAEGCRRIWADRDLLKRTNERRKATWSDPARRKAQSEKQKERWDDEARQHQSEEMRRVSADPEERQRRRDRMHNYWQRIREQGLTGEIHPGIKLNEQSVAEIRKLWGEGINKRVLAEQFGVSTTTVHRIIHRITWAHVP